MIASIKRSYEQLTNPYGEDGNGNEDRCSDCPNGVRPAAGAVHDAVKQPQLPLEERGPCRVENDLEVSLLPKQETRMSA